MKLIAVLIIALAAASCSDPAEEGRQNAKRYLEERAKKDKEQEKLQEQVIKQIHQVETCRKIEIMSKCFLEDAPSPGEAQLISFDYIDSKNKTKEETAKLTELLKSKDLNEEFVSGIKSFWVKYDKLCEMYSNYLFGRNGDLAKSKIYSGYIDNIMMCMTWKDIQAVNLFPPEIQ